jgi:hypothetical protein
MRSIALACLAIASTPLVKADADQEVSLVAGTSGTWNLDWEGVGERTYFVQWSLDLKEWHFFDLVEYGAGPMGYGFISSSEKFFVRLEYADIPSVNPEGDDYDGDGLSNIDEVGVHDTDPLQFDTDGDGMDDGWEIQHGLDARDDGTIDQSNGPMGDPDGDGLKNIDEYWNNGNPNSI